MILFTPCLGLIKINKLKISALAPKSLRCFTVFLIALFLAGSWPIDLGRPAEARTKKITRKVKSKKLRKVRKKAAHKIKKKAKAAVRSKKKKKTAVSLKPAAKKPSVPGEAYQYPLPSRSGSVTQRYSLEEGLGGDEADNVISGLKAVGADDISVDPAKNTVTVTYNTSNLTAVGVVKKLKSLGYTARRIY